MRGRRIVLLPSTDKVSVRRAAILRRKEKAVTRERERESFCLHGDVKVMRGKPVVGPCDDGGLLQYLNGHESRVWHGRMAVLDRRFSSAELHGTDNSQGSVSRVGLVTDKMRESLL